jgi:2-phospho-L-lactate guanylyltransferase
MRLLIPVKSLDEAKSRLEPDLVPVQRRRLAIAMFEDVIVALSQRPWRRTIEMCTEVLTRDPEVASLAARHGIAVRQEPRDGLSSVNELLGHALEAIARENIPLVAILPSDLPLVEPSFLTALLRFSHSDAKPRSVVGPTLWIAPNRQGEGSNLLALSPPELLVPSFGPGSFERHCRAALQAGATIQELTGHGLDLDIDALEDLSELARRLANLPPERAPRTREAIKELVLA